MAAVKTKKERKKKERHDYFIKTYTVPLDDHRGLLIDCVLNERMSKVVLQQIFFCRKFRAQQSPSSSSLGFIDFNKTGLFIA